MKITELWKVLYIKEKMTRIIEDLHTVKLALATWNSSRYKSKLSFQLQSCFLRYFQAIMVSFWWNPYYLGSFYTKLKEAMCLSSGNFIAARIHWENKCLRQFLQNNSVWENQKLTIQPAAGVESIIQTDIEDVLTAVTGEYQWILLLASAICE